MEQLIIQARNRYPYQKGSCRLQRIRVDELRRIWIERELKKYDNGIYTIDTTKD